MNDDGNIGIATEFLTSKLFDYSCWHTLTVKVNCSSTNEAFLQLQVDDFIFPQNIFSDLIDLSPHGPFTLKDSFNLFSMKDGDFSFYPPILLRYYKLYTSISDCIIPKPLEFLSK